MGDKESIKKALFITLSNIGDCLLTLPVLDLLKENYPDSEITVMVGPRPKEIFAGNPHIHRVIIYDKQSKLKRKIELFKELNKENFDIVLDLRNSLFGMLLNARYKILPFVRVPDKMRHMSLKHLYRALSTKAFRLMKTDMRQASLYISLDDEKYIDQIWEKNKIGKSDKVVVIAPGARSHVKRWDKDKFSALAASLIEGGRKIILVGDKDDLSITRYIAEHVSGVSLIDLAAKISIPQLAYLLKKAVFLVTNDSAVLHIAGYSNVPTVAIFGPTDETKYGPWSSRCAVAKKDIICRPCQKAQCRFGTLECMSLVKVDDVLGAVRKVTEGQELKGVSFSQDFRRILIVRTDRIGDVLLSTPVIKALRDSYAHAYIAMMVSPYAKEIVEKNPYLDEVIVYDKEHKHKFWVESLKFALNLKKKRFDLAVILHPLNRVHLVTFFAGIPKRIGYDRKLGFLLTDRLKHAKQLGEQHELEYNLDVLKYLGLGVKNKELFMPIKPESEKWVGELFKEAGVKENDKLLAIHPGASCPSKIWPNKRFADVADYLVEKYGFKVLLIAGPKDIKLAQGVIENMRHPAVNLAGRTSISQLASVLKRCQLFISNDSGPVHIASAVDTPVISIFGRSQKGLSPRRWGPVGKKDKVLHKYVGCIECLAHNCVKEFACLKAITVDDVLNAAEEIISEGGIKR